MHEEIRKAHMNWVDTNGDENWCDQHSFEYGYRIARNRLKKVIIKLCHSIALDETQGDNWETILYALSIIGLPENTFDFCDTLDDVGKEIADIYGLKGGDLYDHNPMSEALL